MAYQLLRTNIALTGNIKTCCYIDNGKISDHVTLNPISTISPIKFDLPDNYFDKVDELNKSKEILSNLNLLILLSKLEKSLIE